MSEPKWTPGPWKASRINMPKAWDYWDIGSIQPDIPVAEIDNTGLGKETEEANAHLIAAAPELYAALALYVDHFGDPLKVARAALAKARGEKP